MQSPRLRSAPWHDISASDKGQTHGKCYEDTCCRRPPRREETYRVHQSSPNSRGPTDRSTVIARRSIREIRRKLTGVDHFHLSTLGVLTKHKVLSVMSLRYVVHMRIKLVLEFSAFRYKNPLTGQVRIASLTPMVSGSRRPIMGWVSQSGNHPQQGG